MILKRVEVANWGNIRGLNSTLPENVPIVVFFAPNGSGKTSLFRAVRTCLFGKPHTSGDSAMKEFVTWGKSEIPRVSVEFQTGGRLYRVTKEYGALVGRRKEAQCHLEEFDGKRWRSVAHAGEAEEQMKSILQKKESLARLLWVDQGTLTLSLGEEDKLALRRQVETILKVMVTDQDQEFRALLGERLARWFRAKGKPVKNSPLENLRAEIEGTKKTLSEKEEEQREAAQIEESLRDIRGQIASEEQGLNQMSLELEALEKQVNVIKNKRARWEDVQRNFGYAKERFETVKERLKERKRIEKSIKEAEGKIKSEQARLKAVRAESKDIEKKVSEAEKEQQSLKRKNAEIEKKQQYVETLEELRKTCAELVSAEAALKRANGIESEVKSLEKKMADEPVPDETELKSLRTLQGQIQKGEVKLQGMPVRVKLETSRNFEVEAKVDGRKERIAVNQNSPLEREGAVVCFDVDRVGRFAAQAAGDAEALRIEIEESRRKFARVLKKYMLAPAEGVLDDLFVRVAQRKNDCNRLNSLNKDIEELAPDGLPQLQACCDNLQKRIGQLKEDYPDLASVGDEDSAKKKIDEEKKLLKESKKRLDAEQKAAEENLKKLNEDKRRLFDENTRILVEIRGLSERSEGSRRRLAELGSEKQLQSDLKKAAREFGSAKKEVKQTRLTQEEEQIEREYVEACAAKEKSGKRLQDFLVTQERLRTQFSGKEGLPATISSLERKMGELTVRYEEEELEANAHQLLANIFDSVREQQVELLSEPVNSRVTRWMRLLGLLDYKGLVFDENAMPRSLDHITLANPVSLGNESFGTQEQLFLLVRLALGAVLARDESETVFLDDPLAHSDRARHDRILQVFREVAEETPGLRLVILTCHPERFDKLPKAAQIDLAALLTRSK
jgi:DNA repair exonuclease SbcCD ATPase subunit